MTLAITHCPGQIAHLPTMCLLVLRLNKYLRVSCSTNTLQHTPTPYETDFTRNLLPRSDPPPRCLELETPLERLKHKYSRTRRILFATSIFTHQNRPLSKRTSQSYSYTFVIGAGDAVSQPRPLDQHLRPLSSPPSAFRCYTLAYSYCRKAAESQERLRQLATMNEEF